MKRGLVFIAMLVCGNIFAQSELGEILDGVETNNLTLKAQRDLKAAQSLEARTGNSLENPTVSYDHMWGNPAVIGKTGEFNFAQGFDFPSVYVYRNRVAKARIEQYGHQYALFRQQLLLQAKTLYIDIISLRQIKRLSQSRLDDAQVVERMYLSRFEAGDVGVLELNRARLNLINARNTFKQTLVELESAMERLANLNGGIHLNIENEAFTSMYDCFDSLPACQQMIEIYQQSDPQLLAYLGELRAAEHGVKVSRGESLPKFELGYRHEFAPGEHFNGITAGMSIPMFGNKNNVKRAKAQAKFAGAQIESSRIDIETALHELYGKAELLNNSLKEYENIQQPSSTLKLLNKGLEEGQISLNDYIAEYETLLTIKESVVVFKRDYLKACAQINAIKL